MRKYKQKKILGIETVATKKAHFSSESEEI